MNAEPFKNWLIDFGWIYCPEALEIDLVERQEDFAKLDMTHPVMQAAARGAQSFFAPEIQAGRVAAQLERVEPVIDGEPREGFLHMTQQLRCGRPDHTHPMDVVEEGRYGPTCLAGLRLAHRFGSRVTDEIERIVRRNLIEWIAGADIEIGKGQQQGAHFFEVVQRQGGSVLARHQLQQGVSCSQTKGWYDPRSFSSEAMACSVITHEVWHGFGVGHTQRRDSQTGELATMHPSIHSATQRRKGRSTSADRDLLRGVGYTITSEPRNVGNGPTPPQPPTPDPRIAFGAIKLNSEVSAGDYEMVFIRKG